MIGYVLGRFPELSTTFVLNELLELEAQGVSLAVIALRRPSDPLVHEGFGRLQAPVSYLPGIPGLVGEQLRLRREVPAARRLPLDPATRSHPRWVLRVLQAGSVARRARHLRLTHLHAHFANHPASVAMLASRLSGIPFSFTAHAVDLFRRDVAMGLLRRKIAAARFVATVSEFNLQLLRELAPESAEKIVLVRNGIELDRFRPAEPVSGPFRFICVARLVEKKGLPVLIEACRVLAGRGLAFRCDIIGQGPLRRQLESRILEGGLGNQVRLLGPAIHSEVLRGYQQAHAYVLPCVVAMSGDRDGLPVSLVEALACGLPVISTPVTGIPEVVTDGENGLLVPAGDSAALAEAMARVIEDRELHRRLAEHARPSVVARFDQRQTVAALRGLLLGRAG